MRPLILFPADVLITPQKLLKNFGVFLSVEKHDEKNYFLNMLIQKLSYIFEVKSEFEFEFLWSTTSKSISIKIKKLLTSAQVNLSEFKRVN